MGRVRDEYETDEPTKKYKNTFIIILSIWLAASLIAPFTIPSNSVNDLSGRASYIDNEKVRGKMNPFAATVYFLSDIFCAGDIGPFILSERKSDAVLRAMHGHQCRGPDRYADRSVLQPGIQFGVANPRSASYGRRWRHGTGLVVSINQSIAGHYRFSVTISIANSLCRRNPGVNGALYRMRNGPPIDLILLRAKVSRRIFSSECRSCS